MLDDCRIETPTRTSNGAGGRTTTWAESGDVPCRLAPASSKVGGDPSGLRIDERTTHILTLPFDAAVSTDSRVVLEGEAWTVTALHKRGADLFVRRVEVALLGNA